MILEIQELSVQEIEQVSGGSLEIDQTVAQAATGDFPQIENDPPG